MRCGVLADGADLGGVHALVGELEQRGRGGGLVGDGGQAARGADAEHVAPLGESGGAVGDQRIVGGEPSVQQEAELIAAEAIGPPVVADRRAQGGPEPGQQRIAGSVAEGVVVALEAVEIEEHERLGVELVGVGDGDVQIPHQPPAVAQAREAVGQRVQGAVAQHPDVLHEGENRAHGAQDERGRRQHHRGGRHVAEGGVDEQHQGQDDEAQRQDDDLEGDRRAGGHGAWSVARRPWRTEPSRPATSCPGCRPETYVPLAAR